MPLKLIGCFSEKPSGTRSRRCCEPPCLAVAIAGRLDSVDFRNEHGCEEGRHSVMSKRVRDALSHGRLGVLCLFLPSCATMPRSHWSANSGDPMLTPDY